MNKLKFEFTIDQTNLILAALGRMPYENVYNMIAEVQNQAKSQTNQEIQSRTPAFNESDPKPE